MLLSNHTDIQVLQLVGTLRGLPVFRYGLLNDLYRVHS